LAGPSVHAGVPLQHVRGALARTLAQIRENPDPHPASPHDYVDPNTGLVDWSFANYDTQLEESLEVRMSAQLAQNLAEYLDGDCDPDSDDDLEERSQLDNSSDSDIGESLIFFL
jgi:hypothetical protein